MSVETNLVQAIETACTSLGTRVYALTLPQSPTLPALTYQRVSAVPGMAHDGDAQLTTYRFQLTTYAATYAACETVAAALRTNFHAKRGAVSTNYVSWIANDLDDYDAETLQYRRIVDLMVMAP